MKYSLVVADFDDTTVSDDLVISPKVRNAIHDYIKRGGLFTFCTGRMIEGVIGYARDLGLKGEVIGYQGAEVADIESGENVFRDQIPYETALKICNFLDEKKGYYQIYDGGRFFVAYDNEKAQAYEVFTGVPRNIANMQLSEYIKANKISPIKIMLRIESKLNEFYLEMLKKHFGSFVNINTSKKHLIKIVNKSVDKGRAVERLANRLGVPRALVACIGDALSDVPMIIYAGLGACMENGSDVAKENADVIVPSVNEDGLAYFINTYCI